MPVGGSGPRSEVFSCTKRNNLNFTTRSIRVLGYSVRLRVASVPSTSVYNHGTPTPEPPKPLRLVFTGRRLCAHTSDESRDLDGRVTTTSVTSKFPVPGTGSTLIHLLGPTRARRPVPVFECPSWRRRLGCPRSIRRTDRGDGCSPTATGRCPQYRTHRLRTLFE